MIALVVAPTTIEPSPFIGHTEISICGIGQQIPVTSIPFWAPTQRNFGLPVRWRIFIEAEGAEH